MRMIMLSLAVVCLLCGCKTSQQRVTFNSLATVGYTVDAAFKVYVDLLIEGKIKKETLPSVAGAYTQFQTAFNAAVAVAQFSKNSIAPQNVIEASSVVLNSIIEAKEAKGTP